jgi:hypothetical protein
LHLLNSSELPASFSGETVHFRCKWTPPWSFSRRALHRDVLGHANPTSPPSSSPTPASSFPTPARSYVAVVHLWPKVSTSSRSSRRFLSVLPFLCTFGCHPHRIPISLPLSVRRKPSRPLPELHHRPPFLEIQRLPSLPIVVSISLSVLSPPLSVPPLARTPRRPEPR